MRNLSQGPGYTSTEVTSTIKCTGQDDVVSTASLLTGANLKTTQGADIPNFKRRLKLGELLPFTWFQQFDVWGQASGTYSTSSSSCTTNITPVWIPSEDWPIYREELEDEAAQRDPYPLVQAVASKIYSDGHDTLTFLAELRQVVAMFRGIVPRIAELIRKGRLDNLWLEGRYGWRTLLYDIEDLNKAIISLNVNRKARAKDRVGTGERWTSIHPIQYKSNNVGSWEVHIHDEWEASLRGSMVADFSPSRFQFNPITTAWELTRLSFVVDWIVNIGGYLEAMSFLTLSSEYAAAVGWKVTCKRTMEVENLSWNAGYTGSITGEAVCEASYTLRIPASVSKLPQFRLNLDWLKVTDLLALIYQALRGK